MNLEMTLLIERRLKTLQIIIMACIMSLAAFAILSNFPTRSALENLVKDAPPIV